MFDWFRKKAPTSDAIRVFQLRQELAADIAGVFAVYRERRLVPLAKGYLDVFRDRLQKALKREDAPPRLLAEAETTVLDEQIDDLKSKLFAEALEKMAALFKLAEGFDVRPEIEEATRDSVAQFCEELRAAGVKVIEQYAPVIADADRVWRQKYPEKVAQFTKKG